MEKLVKKIYAMAQKLGVCTKFTGNEGLEQIVTLFFSPQGVEFCKNYNFPSLQILRQFKQYKVERFGAYIDAGNIKLNNVRRALLIGNTNATLTFSDNTQRHEVIMMHGAKAKIIASGWAVVCITCGSGCEVAIDKKDNARIL